MQITTNLGALAVQGSYRRSLIEAAASVQRMSSGQRINSASDDAAGLAIAERLTAGVNGLSQAARNADAGLVLVQTAGGALDQIIGNFQRMRELAVGAGNGGLGASDRAAMQQESNALVASNEWITADTSFNRLRLLDGSFSGQFQVGADVGDSVALSIPAVLAQRGAMSVTVSGMLRQVNATVQVAGAIGAGDLRINGTAIGASQAGAAPGQGSASAYAIAAAINLAAPLDVSASASNTLSGSAAAGGLIPNGGLSINGVALGAISGASAAALAASAAAAIEAAAGASGVSASASGDTLTLTAADGRDIDISALPGGYAGLLGLGEGTHHGSLTLSDVPVISNHSVTIGGNNPAAAGLAAGQLAAASTGQSGSGEVAGGAGGEPAVDLSSFAGATAALRYIDGKLASSGAIRAMLGATENRLSGARANIDSSAAVLAGARSRIRDVDYASESAQLTRSQILQQAATAMLAQANAQPRQALQLLR